MHNTQQVTTVNGEIAERIKYRREELWRRHGTHTQEYVADRLGISRPAYTRWESGETSITGESLLKLADILQCDVTYFYGLDESGRRSSDPDADAALLAEAQRLGFHEDLADWAKLSEDDRDAFRHLVRRTLREDRGDPRDQF